MKESGEVEFEVEGKTSFGEKNSRRFDVPKLISVDPPDRIRTPSKVLGHSAESLFYANTVGYCLQRPLHVR